MSKTQATIILIVMAGSSIAAQPEIRTLSILESAEIHVKPDLGAIEFVVEARDKDRNKAYQINEEAMLRVKEVLKTYGIESDDMKSNKFLVERTYRYDKNQNRIFDGYCVYHEMQVETRDLDKIMQIADEILEAGATRIKGIAFRIEDPTPYIVEVRTKAMKKAEEKARHIAGLAGMKLGKPLIISELKEVNDRSPVGIIPDITISADASGSVTIEPGDIKLTYTIYITYELQ
ncbi:SIMPL domain-containing protein [candidate division WOR-3 bacterium]|nr:SIMPL domain-containing protein [candidate division WOR-3 bacterium]